MEKKILISSKVENLRLVESFIEEVCNECKIDQEKYGNILISSLEAANNAIVHGNKLNESSDVTITAKIKEKELNIIIQDRGKGFDFKEIPDPTEPENIEKLNGRGIFLMKKLSDRINFRDNGTIVELIFNI